MISKDPMFKISNARNLSLILYKWFTWSLCRTKKVPCYRKFKSCSNKIRQNVSSIYHLKLDNSSLEICFCGFISCFWITCIWTETRLHLMKTTLETHLRIASNFSWSTSSLFPKISGKFQQLNTLFKWKLIWCHASNYRNKKLILSRRCRSLSIYVYFPGLVDSTNALCNMLKPLNWIFVTSWTAATPNTQASGV